MSSKNEKTINQKIEELRQMVAWFESDDFDIEQAIERYQAAEKLASDIEKDLWLSRARRTCRRGAATYKRLLMNYIGLKKPTCWWILARATA